MLKIKGVALTEKGVVKANVRKTIADMALGLATENLKEVGFETFEDRNSLALAFVDNEGNKVYATFALTVGTKAPNEKAVRKSTHKKVEAEEIVIGD